MSINDELLYLESEITEIKNILSMIPSEDIIERNSLECRLKSVQDEFDALKLKNHPKRASLTFRGDPVVGSEGIVAEFASKAMGAFSDAYAMIVAGLFGSLSDRGPIAEKSKNQLLITGTAVGSFGFEFELPEHQNEQNRLFDEKEKNKEAIDIMQDLFKLSDSGSDDELAEIVEKIHPRAVRKFSEFLEYLVQSNAWCGLEFNDKVFKYKDFDQINRSAERLKNDYISEYDEEFCGEFRGVMPHYRDFEFLISKGNEIIKGKLDSSFENPAVINSEWLNKPVVVNFHVIKVGKGRNRYILTDIDKIKLNNTED